MTLGGLILLTSFLFIDIEGGKQTSWWIVKFKWSDSNAGMFLNLAEEKKTTIKAEVSWTRNTDF